MNSSGTGKQSSGPARRSRVLLFVYVYSRLAVQVSRLVKYIAGSSLHTVTQSTRCARGSPPLCPLSGSNRQHFFSIHTKHDLQILHALWVVLFALSFPFERFFDDCGFAFLDLKDPSLDCVLDLGSDKLSGQLLEVEAGSVLR